MKRMVFDAKKFTNFARQKKPRIFAAKLKAKLEQLLFKSEKKILGFRNLQKNEGKLLIYHNLSMYLIIVNT